MLYIKNKYSEKLDNFSKRSGTSIFDSNYNITKKNYSIVQIAKMFKTRIKYLPPRPGDRSKSTIPNNNSYKILGYKTKIDIKTGLGFKKNFSA